MKNYIYYLVIGITFFVISIFNTGCVSSDQAQTKNNVNLEVVETPASFALQERFISKLNQLRAEGRKCGDQYFPAAKPLKVNKRLTQTAYQHSKDMSEHQFLDHHSSDGDTLVERLEEADYKWRTAGENVAHNQRSIEEVLEDWLSSPGHCSNMMSAEYNQTGIAQVNWYWTQVYAKP